MRMHDFRYRGVLHAVVLAAVLAGCGGGEEAVDDEVGTVVLGPQDVALAEISTIQSGVALTGTLQPYRMAEVKAQVPGLVTAVNADEGEAVTEGRLLARIEAQGIVSQAAGARSGVAAAEANLALAERQLASARTLFDAGAMSEIEFRSAQTQFEAAQAQLASARAQAAGANEQAARTTVTAPFAGEISSRSVNQGEAVNPGQTLFTLVNSAVLELQGQVPVDQASQVREGQEVAFHLDAYPGVDFRGTVARVSPVADPGTRQVGVVLRLPNEDRTLIGGVFATGRVITGAEQSAVVVPESAIRGSNGDRHLYVIEGGVLTRRDVVVGSRDEDRGVIAISTGLAAGEQVLVSPGDVTAGARVTMEAEMGDTSIVAQQEEG